MKKIISIAFAAILAGFAISCQKEESVSEKTEAVQYTFNITVNDQAGFDNDASTKGSEYHKSYWENGDKIFLFFKPTDGNLLNTYATLTYDGSEWGVDAPGLSGLGEGGTLSAVYVYNLDGSVTPAYSDSKWTIATGNVFYNCQTGVSYTVSDSNEISATLNLKAPTNFVRFYVEGATGVLTCDKVKGWKDIAIGSEMTFSNVTCTGYMDGFANSGDSNVKEYYGRIVGGGTKLKDVPCNFSVVKDGKVYERTTTPSSDAKSFTMNTSATDDKKWTEASGKLPGLFTISKGADNKAGTADDVQVRFSQGNLWADDDKALHFEANQYAFSSIYNSDHVSHFIWSSTVENAVNGPASGNYLFCDESHKVSVDDGEAIYYALSKDEWEYLIDTRTMTNSKARYSNASPGITIGGAEYYGVFLYPDNYNGEVVVSDSMTWDAINAAGIVFLPAAGHREGPNVSSYDSEGFYWSSSECSSGSYLMYFNNTGNDYTEHVDPSKDDYYLSNREKNYSVRLVTEVK